MRTDALKKDKGFTLLEVVIALTILTIGVLGIFQLFPSALRNVRLAAARREVASLASGVLGQARMVGAETWYKNRIMEYVVEGTDPWSRSGLDSYAATASMYDAYATTLERMSGAGRVYLQRITFTADMFDGRKERFVTYVAGQ